MGARRPYLLCSEIEALAGAGRAGEASPLLETLAADLEALRPALEAELAQAERRPQPPETT